MNLQFLHWRVQHKAGRKMNRWCDELLKFCTVMLNGITAGHLVPKKTHDFAILSWEHLISSKGFRQAAKFALLVTRRSSERRGARLRTPCVKSQITQRVHESSLSHRTASFRVCVSQMSSALVKGLQRDQLASTLKVRAHSRHIALMWAVTASHVTVKTHSLLNLIDSISTISITMALCDMHATQLFLRITSKTWASQKQSLKWLTIASE